jgi:hypothetical protein
MTWGQLRFQLQTGAPGVPADLLDEFLNTTYEAVLEATDWQGLKYHCAVQTLAAYQSATDTVTLTVGQTGVTGLGTNWGSSQSGLKFYRPGDTPTYVFTQTGATTATLDRPYEGNGIDAAGTVYLGAAYVLMQNVYALPSDVRTVVSVLDPMTGFPLQPFSQDRLDQSAGPRTLVQDPVSYAITDDSGESGGAVVHQIEFFPPPVHARAMSVEYVHAALAFDGASTQTSPLPFVSTGVLLDGARAKVARHLAGSAEAPAAAAGYSVQANSYEALFQLGLRRMLLLEHSQKRPKATMRMADRFVRHRMARAARGRNNNWGPGMGGPN